MNHPHCAILGHPICKHVLVEGEWISCRHPGNRQCGISTAYARAPDGWCGPDATKFEAREAND